MRRQTIRFMRSLFAAWLMPSCCLASTMACAAQSVCTACQSPADTWFTGPLLANSATTLPHGHWLIEPYLYDVASRHADSYGSLTYMLYGVTDRLTVGLIPVFGYNQLDGEADSSGVGVGDVSMLAQYRLITFPAERSLPTVSVQLKETFPTGRYDRLGKHRSDGLGSGARVTTLALNTQTWFWLANGHILRMRLNASRSFPDHANLAGTSVYGTTHGFRGKAMPGAITTVNAAWEYSLDRHWALAMDLVWSRSSGTRVTGHDFRSQGMKHAPVAIDRTTTSRKTFAFAPAVEYHWTPRVGLIAGVRVITGPDMSTTTTPIVAINIAH